MIRIEPFVTLALGSPVGQLRARRVRLGPDAPRGVLVAYAADFDVDPYVEMFFFPKDTLKLAVFTEEGELLWRRDLGPGVVPGMWFCPVHAFDLDEDGVDEIWFVDNVNTKHPLGLSGYRLARLDARTGQPTGQWPWPARRLNQPLSSTFRNFIRGGRVRGRPVLFTAQGTYGDMFLQGWNPDLSLRWERHISADEPGARGSHMAPVVDLDGDGIEEVLWGERCIELDAGRELFCADRDLYRGHSDIIQPVLGPGGEWFIYTCRESDNAVSPRVALFDAKGRRIWGALDHGHIDMGWVARLGPRGEKVASAIRIGHKTCGPDGRFHQDREEFIFDALTGRPARLPFPVYQTIPVDVNGDGLHELVRGIPGSGGEVLDASGRVVGNVGGPVALACKCARRPGEQILSYQPDGTVRLWADRNAEDSAAALARYANPYYEVNHGALGGL